MQTHANGDSDLHLFSFSSMFRFMICHSRVCQAKNGTEATADPFASIEFDKSHSKGKHEIEQLACVP